MSTKSKEYYIKAYNDCFDKALNEAKKECKECGLNSAMNRGSFDSIVNDILEETITAEGIVGYYLTYYGKEAFEQWKNNLKASLDKWKAEPTPIDNKVSEIFKIMFDI